MLTKRKKQEKWLTQEQYDALSSLEDGVDYHITNAKIDYNTEVSNKPILKTDNTTAQSTNASETITGTINLHKVAKTGTYTDLLSKPTLGTAAAKDAGTQNGVADLDANGKVPFNELPLDALTGSSAPTTSTAANYVGQWYLDTTNSKTYQCTAITSNGGTPPTYTYTWVEMARSSSISGKVDKSSSNNQIYGTDGSGNQTTYLLSTSPIVDAIPKYNADKRLKVDDPSAYNDVANKNYVDTNFSKLDASNLSSTDITSWNSALKTAKIIASTELTGSGALSITLNNLTIKDGVQYKLVLIGVNNASGTDIQITFSGTSNSNSYNCLQNGYYNGSTYGNGTLETDAVKYLRGDTVGTYIELNFMIKSTYVHPCTSYSGFSIDSNGTQNHYRDVHGVSSKFSTINGLTITALNASCVFLVGTKAILVEVGG